VSRIPRRKPIVPGPIRHESEYERFHHLDMKRLTPADAWAELELARMELARCVFRNQRERIIGFDCDHRPISDQAWLRCRIALLTHKLEHGAAA